VSVYLKSRHEVLLTPPLSQKKAMSGDVESKQLRRFKKRRIDISDEEEHDSAEASALKFAGGRALPSVLERAILSFVAAVDLDVVALLSKACLRLVKEHLQLLTHRKTLRVLPPLCAQISRLCAVDLHLVSEDSFVWSLVMKHCRRIQSMTYSPSDGDPGPISNNTQAGFVGLISKSLTVFDYWTEHADQPLLLALADCAGLKSMEPAIDLYCKEERDVGLRVLRSCSQLSALRLDPCYEGENVTPYVRELLQAAAGLGKQLCNAFLTFACMQDCRC
jgi:hypothetical protein